MRRNILICTVGTSLFKPNLDGLKKSLADGTISSDRRPLAEAYQRLDWRAVANELGNLPAEDRVCGAEINSIASMIAKGYVAADCGLYFLHSATPDGGDIASILKLYYDKGHAPVKCIPVSGLQDTDTRLFRTKGLRNLAREICAVIHEHSAAACAINATGGYKAQIAVGVLLGQAIGVPVYYKHEHFPEIIAFPPMPVALDFDVWMRASGMLNALESSLEPIKAAIFDAEWDEKYESLVERVSIDGLDYLELSPVGQIFHGTFRERFRTARDQVLSPAVPLSQKRPPRLEKSGWPGEHRDVEQFMRRVTDEVPQVAHCATFYYDPDLAERTRFRLGSQGIEGIYSNGSFMVKFRVETSAQTPGQQAAVVAHLNEWLMSSIS